MIDFDTVIGSFGPFTIYGSKSIETDINFLSNLNRIEDSDLYVELNDFSELEVYLSVSGYNPIKAGEGYLHMVVWRSQSFRRFQFKVLRVIDPGEFTTKDIVAPPVVYTYPYVLIEFYLSNEIGGKPIKKVPIKINKPALANVILNYNKQQTLYPFIIIPSFYSKNLPPRVLGVYTRLRRNIQVWGSAMMQAGRKIFVLAKKSGGLACPFCGHARDEQRHRKKDSSYKTLDVVPYQADAFCDKCFGTGMYGAFDYIRLGYGGIYTTSVITGDGLIENIGSVILEASTPIKPSDYITDLMDVYIVQVGIEIREFYELPLYYRAEIRSAPAQNPIRRIIPYILENFNRYIWSYRIPDQSIFDETKFVY